MLARCLHFWYSLGKVGEDLSIFPSLQNPVALINDFCGPDRRPERKEALPQPNVRYVPVKLNGWPHIFVVATRDIAAGDVLRSDYGDDFWLNHEALHNVGVALDDSWKSFTTAFQILLQMLNNGRVGTAANTKQAQRHQTVREAAQGGDTVASASPALPRKRQRQRTSSGIAPVPQERGRRKAQGAPRISGAGGTDGAGGAGDGACSTKGRKNTKGGNKGAFDPAQLLGTRVAKHFDGFGMFYGTVKAVSSQNPVRYIVEFDDQDQEEWTKADVKSGTRIVKNISVNSLVLQTPLSLLDTVPSMSSSMMDHPTSRAERRARQQGYFLF